jgi:hypothetical protein
VKGKNMSEENKEKMVQQESREMVAFKNNGTWITSLCLSLIVINSFLIIVLSVLLLPGLHYIFMYFILVLPFVMVSLHLFFVLWALNVPKIIAFAVGLLSFFFRYLIIVCPILDLIWIGIFAEIAILVFQLITLPVEFDASRKALREEETMGLLIADEMKGSKKMLRAAAFTYVASTLAALLQMLRLVLAFSRDD